MIYTLGEEQIYDEALNNNGDVRKMGRDSKGAYEGFPGGSVWMTLDEARRAQETWRQQDWLLSIYRVDADWFEHTYEADDGSRHLLVERQILAKVA